MVMMREKNDQKASVTEQDMIFWGFEEDLTSLACHAAIEIDNLILSKSDKMDAIKRLITVISNSGLILDPSEETNGRPWTQLNPSTVVALNWAIDDAKIAEKVDKIDELGKETRQIKNRLEVLSEDPQKELKKNAEKIKELRSFCLALSKRTLANKPSLYDLQPEHPHRR